MVDISGYKGLSYAILLEALIELKSKKDIAAVEQYLDGFNETLWGEVLPVPRTFIHRTKILVRSKKIKTVEDLKNALWELMLISLVKHGQANTSEISRNLSMPVGSICRSLRKLRQHGVIFKRGNKYKVSSRWKKYFGVSGQSIKI